MIVCICRGKSETGVLRAIDGGAETLLDLQRCGIGDQCGSCHTSLRTMLLMATAKGTLQAEACPACVGEPFIAAATA